jgi:hypothetical protein
MSIERAARVEQAVEVFVDALGDSLLALFVADELVGDPEGGFLDDGMDFLAVLRSGTPAVLPDRAWELAVRAAGGPDSSCIIYRFDPAGEKWIDRIHEELPNLASCTLAYRCPDRVRA